MEGKEGKSSTALKGRVRQHRRCRVRTYLFNRLYLATDHDNPNSWAKSAFVLLRRDPTR
jgi:hypothetical protein